MNIIVIRKYESDTDKPDTDKPEKLSVPDPPARNLGHSGFQNPES
jgi:hypothetical protein